jgi:hypothetical protein
MSKVREMQNTKIAPYTKQGKQSWAVALFRIRADPIGICLRTLNPVRLKA